MSAWNWDIMQENVSLIKNGSSIAQASRKGETRAHVRGVRAHLARRPKTRQNGEPPRKLPARERVRCVNVDSSLYLEVPLNTVGKLTVFILL